MADCAATLLAECDRWDFQSARFCDPARAPGWTIQNLPRADIFSDREFNILKGQFDDAIAWWETNQPERPAHWGFVTHLSEYAPGNDGAPPTQSALDALDRFLTYVDQAVADGKVTYASVSEIAETAR